MRSVSDPRLRVLTASGAGRTELQPARSYEVPGGPAARDLGTVDLAKLAEIARGGANDTVR